MSFLRACLVPLLLAGASCSDGANGAERAAPAYRPVLTESLAALDGRGLPGLSDDELLEIREMVEAVPLGGRVGGRARRQLEEMDAGRLMSGLLGIVDGRDFEDPARAAAYAWIDARAIPAIVPRLALRLKYEKDWVANSTIARVLLRYDNGSGLDALATILETEGDPSKDLARSAAAAALAELPAREGWQPGADFSADWSHLLETNDRWLQSRRLDDFRPTADPLPADVSAEVWKMISKFESQPLRPVDDARFVLTRLDGRVIPELCEVLADESHYVREHALQTLAWMGYCVGHWVTENQFDYLGRLEIALRDPSQRTRVLEALGGSGLDAAADLLVKEAVRGDAETLTAAADALLRCAGSRHQADIEQLAAQDWLSPEAQYSFALLLSDLDPEAPKAVAPAELDSAERDRRDRWAAMRPSRPSAN